MSRRVLVIGAGITGVSTAEWLRRAGATVTLIDRIEPGDPRQTSYGNAGLLARCAVVPVSVPGLARKAPKMLLDPSSPLFMKWRYLPRLLPWVIPFLRNGSREKVTQIARGLAPLTDDSVDQHLAIAKGTPAEAFISTGDYIYLYPDRAAYDADGMGMSLRRELGFDIEELDRAELVKRDPQLSLAYSFGANFPDHGWIAAPGKYVAALFEHFRQNGGEFLEGEVMDIRDGAITLRGGQEVTADNIVIATGAWSRPLAAKLGNDVNLETERGYHVYLKNPSHVPDCPYMVTDGKFAATPMEDGLRCAGVVEFGGLDAPPSKAPVELLKRGIHRVYPDLTWESEDVWMGHRPSTTDSLPVLGHASGAPSVIYAFGSQHIGLTIGPRLGRMAAELVMGTTSNMDLSPYRPDRF